MVHRLSHRHRGVGDVSGPEELGAVSGRAAGHQGEAGGRQGGVGEGPGGAGGDGEGGEGAAGSPHGRQPAAAGTPERHQLLAGGVSAGERESHTHCKIHRCFNRFESDLLLFLK